MKPNSSVPEQVLWDALRRQRAELRESMGALEDALAAPPSAGQARWAERIHVALVELSADFREHIVVTEGENGFYRDLLESTPRLSGAITRLKQEHTQITDLVNDLLERVPTPASTQDMDRVRDLGTALLGKLVRHRQRGSDLVYEAYELDVGGET